MICLIRCTNKHHEKQISKIFSSDGELSKNIKGFKPRAEQLEMAQSVGYAIQNKQPLVVEAGTGTGKTFAYLAPALIAGKKTIISTALKIYKINSFQEIYLP